jgi:hypothetical protein
VAEPPPFRHFRGQSRPNIACHGCEIWKVVGDSPHPKEIRLEGNSTMIRSSGAAGFDGRRGPVASSRLAQAVAASLAIGSLSLCLIVALTVLSIKASMAMPFPA